jgi:hypothetical protein
LVVIFRTFSFKVFLSIIVVRSYLLLIFRMMVFANLNKFDPFEYLKNLDLNSTEIQILLQTTNNFSKSDFQKKKTVERTELLKQLIIELKTNRPLHLSKSEVLDILVQKGVFHGIILNNYSTKFSLKEQETAVNSLLNSIFKFVFVRHPFERLVSAYFNKFVNLVILQICF